MNILLFSISNYKKRAARSSKLLAHCCDHVMSSAQDCFFYSLVFDPVQKTLLADQGEIRVGSKYQAEIPDKLADGKKYTKSKEY